MELQYKFHHLMEWLCHYDEMQYDFHKYQISLNYQDYYFFYFHQYDEHIHHLLILYPIFAQQLKYVHIHNHFSKLYDEMENKLYYNYLELILFAHNNIPQKIKNRGGGLRSHDFLIPDQAFY